MPQPGIPGPHVGTGKLAVTLWWLGIASEVAGEREAKAPASTTKTAKMRTASFIKGYL